MLLLFAHNPLINTHGFRTNNMETAVFLAYAAGVYHFLAWRKSGPDDKGHLFAIALFFVLGFMTKFVAAVFLPLVVFVTVVVVGDYRRKFFTTWTVWAAGAALMLLLCAPWFIWASMKYGAFFWQTILSEAVYRRFTTFLNPVHVQPWYYYFLTMWERFGDADINYLLAAGIIVLLVQTIRRDQHRDRPADDLRRCIAIDALGPLVPTRDATLQSLADDCIL